MRDETLVEVNKFRSDRVSAAARHRKPQASICCFIKARKKRMNRVADTLVK